MVIFPWRQTAAQHPPTIQFRNTKGVFDMSLCTRKYAKNEDNRGCEDWYKGILLGQKAWLQAGSGLILKACEKGVHRRSNTHLSFPTCASSSHSCWSSGRREKRWATGCDVPYRTTYCCDRDIHALGRKDRTLSCVILHALRLRINSGAATTLLNNRVPTVCSTRERRGVFPTWCNLVHLLHEYLVISILSCSSRHLYISHHQHFVVCWLW